MLTFRDLLFLLLLPAIPLLFWVRRQARVPSSVLLPDASRLTALPGSVARRLAGLPSVLRALALALLIVGLARPQAGRAETRVRSEGIDMVLAVDLSTSMFAEDFVQDGKRLNRLEALRPVVTDFIEKRPNDRFGVVTFA